MRTCFLLILIILLLACNMHSNPQPLNIDGYNWAGMKKITLQSRLNEISGIAYDKATSSLLAINDEQGVLYSIDINNYKIKQSLKFGKSGDYECVSIGANQVFILNSNGNIHTMALNGDVLSDIATHKYTGNETEFEATLWDEQNKKLYVISKKSHDDHKTKSNQIYVYDPATGIYDADPALSIPWKGLKNEGIIQKGFHPSAAAVQYGTKDIFLLSSIEKLLIIFDRNWHFKSVHSLDPQLFQQPEGMTFDEQNNLYISNEAAGLKPTIIFIPHKY